MSEVQELLRKVRQIEIQSRGISDRIFSGEYHSAFKGRGMAFSEVREYMPGDEVRTIDWNVTARYETPFVKIFEEGEIGDRLGRVSGLAGALVVNSFPLRRTASSVPRGRRSW